MSFYIFLGLGFLGGIPAGMGMGGGTVTIPLLLLFSVEQKVAQCANLFAFLPMSLVALKTHAENGLLETKGMAWVIIPAVIFSVGGAFLAAYLPSVWLRRAFGVFLICLAIFSFKGKAEKS